MRSSDGGQTFTAVFDVGYCEAVGFGKAADGVDYPAVYVYADIDGVPGVYRSIDEGNSWVRVNDDEHEYGGLANGEFVRGDMNVFGRVYMSTAGRGIVYGEPTSGGPDIKPGDLNADGDVSSLDYILMRRYLLGTVSDNEISTVGADVNSDGGINSLDYMMLRRYLLGIISEL